MMLSIDRLVANGKYGMINMQSWMFLSSFENFVILCLIIIILKICFTWDLEHLMN